MGNFEEGVTGEMARGKGRQTQGGQVHAGNGVHGAQRRSLLFLFWAKAQGS